MTSPSAPGMTQATCAETQSTANYNRLEAWNFHPQQLAIDLAAAEHLHIDFDDNRDKPWSSKFTVTLLGNE